MTITKDMLIGDILRENPNIAIILMQAGMHCLGCPASQMESIEEASFVHGLDCECLVEDINSFLAEEANQKA